MSEALKNAIPEETPEEERLPEAFIVDDDRKAAWCLRQIANAEQEREKWKKHYADQMRIIDEQADQTRIRMEAYLADYFTRLQESGLTKRTATQESYKLPDGGKLLLKKQQPEYTVKDEDLVPWLEKNAPDFVKIKKTADWAALKKTLVVSGDGMITEDAELVPGITVTPRPDIFKAEV